MAELEAVWADLSQVMQAQVRTAIVNMVAERDGERVAAWSTVRSVLAEVSYLGWQQVWRMVGAMPADAQPVVTSAFADTPMDVRGRVHEIVATRTIVDTLLDQRFAASVSRIEGVDQAGFADLEAQGVIVEQNVVYHLPKGGALVVSVDAQGYRGAMAMMLDAALELPSLVCRKIEQNQDLARQGGDEAVTCQSKPGVIVDEAISADSRHGMKSHSKSHRCRNWHGSSRWVPALKRALKEARARSEWTSISADLGGLASPHRVIADGGVVPDRGDPPGSAIDTSLDPAASPLRAESAAAGGVLSARRGLRLSPGAATITAQRVGWILPSSHPSV